MNRELFDFIKYNTPDDGGGGLVLEGVFEGEEIQEEEFFFLEGDPGIPITEEEVPEDSPEMKALKDQNALLMQQMSGLQVQADSTAALTKGIEELGQNLRQPVQPQVLTPIDPAEAKEKFNKEFYDDPSENLDAFARAKIEPALKQMMQINIQNARQFLMLDPERGEVYKKYTKDVDDVFNQMSPAKQLQDSNAYKEAADIVASRHLPETMASLKEEMKKEMKAEIMTELKLKDPTMEVPGQYSDTGTIKKAAPKGKSYVLPKEVWEFAGLMGYQGRGEKEDQARVYQWWKEGKLSDSGVEYK